MRARGRSVELSLCGDWPASAIRELRAASAAALAHEGEILIIDLTQVARVCDALALWALGFHRAVQRTGRRAVVIAHGDVVTTLRRYAEGRDHRADVIDVGPAALSA